MNYYLFRETEYILHTMLRYYCKMLPSITFTTLLRVIILPHPGSPNNPSTPPQFPYHPNTPTPHSSPHLVEVRERIRINGKSISREMFSDYFWKCYTAFTTTKVSVCMCSE